MKGVFERFAGLLAAASDCVLSLCIFQRRDDLCTKSSDRLLLSNMSYAEYV